MHSGLYPAPCSHQPPSLLFSAVAGDSLRLGSGGAWLPSGCRRGRCLAFQRMPLPKQFLEELPDKTDQQLYFMLGNADDYMPETLEAAKAELGRRGLTIDETILQRYQKDRVMIALQMSGRLPKPARMRGILFLVGGVLGGTIIVTCFSFATNGWSYLYSWLSGLAALVMVFIYFFCKRWLVNQAFRHMQTDVQPKTKESPDA